MEFMGQRHGRLSRPPRRNWASPLMAGLVRSRKAQFRQHCRGFRGLRKLASDLLGPAAITAENSETESASAELLRPVDGVDEHAEGIFPQPFGIVRSQPVWTDCEW